MGSALGTGGAFKLNASDVTSGKGHSRAHVLSGTILIAPVIFTRKLKEQNFTK